MFVTLRRIASMFVLLGLIAASPAQTSKTPPPDQIEEKEEFTTYPLKHSLAEKLCEILDKSLAGRPAKIVADPRSNSIIVIGTADIQRKVKDLVIKLDVEKPSSENQNRLRTFAIPPGQNEDVVVGALRTLMPRIGGQYTLDPARRQVLVYANDDKTREVTELFQQLTNAQGGTPREQDAMVRIVCLVDGVDDKSDPNLPEDFGEVRKALAKLGVTKPHLFAQTMVNVVPGGRFETAGQTNLEAGARLIVSGQFRNKGDMASLSIQIGDQIPGSDGKARTVTNLQTEITAPYGQMVLLGMTPHAKMTKIFVVSVTRNAGK